MNIAEIAAKLKSAFGFLAATGGTIVANVVHRTGTLSSLQSLVSPQGEIAVATDAKALVTVFADGAATIHSTGPASIPAADIATGQVGYFAAGKHNYTYPAAGNAQYANIQALITYLSNCEFSVNAQVNITLEAGQYGGFSVGSLSRSIDLSRVSLEGSKGPVTVTAVSAVTGTAGAYSVTLASTSQPPVGTWVGFLSDQTSNKLALAGCHEVTASTATNFTVSLLGETAPTVGVLAHTGILFRTRLWTVGNLEGIDSTLPKLSSMLCEGLSLSTSGTSVVCVGRTAFGYISITGGTLSANNDQWVSSLECINGTIKHTSGSFVFASIAGQPASFISSDVWVSTAVITGNKAMAVPALGVYAGSRFMCGVAYIGHADFGVQASHGSQFVAGGILATNAVVAANGSMTPLALNTMSADMSYVVG